MIANFHDQRITIMGLGRFGGGLGVTRFLAERGAHVLLTDQAEETALAEPLTELADLIERGTVELALGGHDKSHFRGCDLVVANPAVPQPWKNPFLQTAEQAGIPITTEIRLLLEHLIAQRGLNRIIGVTGTAGKSTTTSMIHHLLRRAGTPAHLGGNIGGSLLNTLDTITPEDWVVLELSSAHLHWLGAAQGQAEALGISPNVAVLTNITPNHLDWHGTLDHYRQSKLNIFQYQTPDDHQVHGDDIPIPDATDFSSFPLPGSHNRQNAAVAIAAVQHCIDISFDNAAALLTDFRGLPHRLNLVLEHDDLRFFDDSKSTTPAAAVLAVEAFDDPTRIHLIAGGYDKKVDLSAISNLAPRLAGMYTIGTTGPAISDTASSSNVYSCHTLEVAVTQAIERMSPGDVLLLSPGCASWDQFEHYEQRGELFLTYARQMLHIQS